MQVLCNIQVFAKAMPSLFAPHYQDFFICSLDSYQIKALKLEILSFIATDSCISSILKEFQVFHINIYFSPDKLWYEVTVFQKEVWVYFHLDSLCKIDKMITSMSTFCSYTVKFLLILNCILVLDIPVLFKI